MKTGRISNINLIVLLSASCCAFVLGLKVQQASADEITIMDGASCRSYDDSCNDCLDNKCVWVPVEGCLESCDMIADTACYSPEYFTSNTNNEICTIAENDKNDSTLCSSKSDCTTCIETTLSDGTNSCQWFQGVDFFDGYCGSECGMFGCGETVCRSEEENINDLSENDCESKLSCQECLNGETSTCGWVSNGIGCLESCSVVADVACYDIESFNSYNSINDKNNNVESFEVMTGNDICVVADNDTADEDLCGSQMDCISCVETALVSNPDKTCQWFEFDHINYCGSKCDMGGCGESTCDSLTSSNDMVSLNNGYNGVEGELVLSKSSVPNETNVEGNNGPPYFEDDKVTSSATSTFLSMFWFGSIFMICFV